MQPDVSFQSNRYATFAVVAALILATFVAFSGVLTSDFVDLDDQDWVVRNPYVNRGLSGATIAWSFLSLYQGNWVPLTWLSLALDRQVFGSNAVGFHATNLLLHTASSLLLFHLL